MVILILKQNILKLKHCKLRTILLMVLFTVLFSAFLVFMVLYDNARENFSYMSRYTINQLTLTARGFPVGTYILDELENDSDVYDYNVMDRGLSGGEMLLDIEPVIEDREKYEQYKEDREKRRKEMQMDYTEPTDCRVYGIKESETNTYFLTQGYQVTDGRHITDKDKNSNAALISEELAKENNLKLGDTITIGPEEDFVYSVEDEYKLQIVGFFKVPFYEDYVKLSEDPRNFIFMHYEPFGNKFYHKYIDGMPGVNGINIFLNDGVDGKAFIERFDKAHSGSQSLSEYRFYTNDDWVEILSFPLREMKRFSNALMIIFLIGICIILLLLSAFLIEKEKKDIRVLYAIGERRNQIIKMIVTGQLIPVLLGGILAIGIAAGLAQTVGNALSENYYDKSEAFAEELIEENIELYDAGEVTMSAPERMTMNVEQRMEFVMMPQTVLVYLFILFAGIPLLIVCQCYSRIKTIQKR